MARRQQLGASIPLVRRVRRHTSMATLYRSTDTGLMDQPHKQELSPGADLDAGTSRPVVTASLLPPGSTLPEGLIVPGGGLESAVQTRRPFAPRVQRKPGSQITSRAKPPPIPTEGTVPSAKAAIDLPVDAAPPTPETTSSITDAEWNRLKAFKRGHEEKMAREAESPERIQRTKEEVEKEAAKQKTKAETRRRQELARLGRLPKAQVVYLSPDEPAPLLTRPIDTPEDPPTEQEHERGVTEEPAIEQFPDTSEEAAEELQTESITEVTTEKPKAEAVPRPVPLAAPEAVKQAPDEEGPEKRIPEPQMEAAVSREEGPIAEQQLESIEAEPPVEPAAVTLQSEPAESPRIQEPDTPSQAVDTVESEEKKGVGRRLIDAARSVFRLREQPPPSPETPVPLAVEEKSLPDVQEEKPIDVPASIEPEIAQELQATELRPEQVDEGTLTQDVLPQPSARPTEVQPTPSIVQRTPEKPEAGVSDIPRTEVPSRQESIPAEEISRSESEIMSDPIVERLAKPALPEPAAEIPTETEPETQVQAEFEPESYEAEPEAPGMIERREPFAEASEDPVVQEEPQPSTSETAEVQLEPEATGPEPAVSEPVVTEPAVTDLSPIDLGIEARTDVIDEVESTTEEAAGRSELPPDPGEVKRVDKPQQKPPMESEERTTDLQQLPLEEVWPVKQADQAPGERVSEPAMQDYIAEDLDESGEMPTLIAQRETAEDITSEIELRRTLDNVSPGKPSDSSVELVSPRRPRPSVVLEQTRLEDPGSSEPPSQPIQRHPEDSESVEKRPILDLPDSGEVRKSTQPRPRPPQPETVKTGIGDLPSDLWQYLGEEPPSRMDTQSTAGGPLAATEVATIQRTESVAMAPAQVLEYSQPTKTLGLDTILPWIQRTDSGEQTESGGSETEPKVIDEDEEGEAEDVDIEKLARDILPIIKRKLSIEWERNRGRF